MSEKKENRKLTRKQFLKTTAGIVTLGLMDPRAFGKNKNEFQKIILGRTGLKVTPIFLGASRTKEPALVKAIIEKGINCLDTGRSYANGQNEVMLGHALKGIRSQVVIQSKVRMRSRGLNLQSAGISGKIKEQMNNLLAASLKALQTDYIDILLYHWAGSPEILFHEAVLDFFTKAKEEGKIRAYGFSAHSHQTDVLEKAIENPFYEVIMVPYNYKGSFIHSLSGEFSEWDQPKLEELLMKCHKNKTAIIAMKTCSAGPFALSDGQEPTYRDAIKWVLKKDFIHAAAVAMLNFDQIDEDLSALK
jgi:aryl-alcohol dehydrogenase-like predicted oxidoreductase